MDAHTDIQLHNTTYTTAVTTARSHDFYKIPFGHRNSCKIPLPLSNVFGKIIQVSQIEHRQPGIPSPEFKFWEVPE